MPDPFNHLQGILLWSLLFKLGYKGNLYKKYTNPVRIDKQVLSRLFKLNHKTLYKNFTQTFRNR